MTRRCPTQPYFEGHRDACYKQPSRWSRLRRWWHEVSPRIDLGNWP